MTTHVTMNTTIPTVKHTAEGWMIVCEDEPSIKPDGPFRSYAAAVQRLDAFVKERGLENTI